MLPPTRQKMFMMKRSRSMASSNEFRPYPLETLRPEFPIS